MSATALGVTGVWGLEHTETGVIQSDFTFDFSIQEKTVLTIQGEVQGLSLYGAKCELSFKGLVPKTSPFASKLGTALTLTNTLTDLMPSSGGTTVIKGITKTGNYENFQEFDVKATNYPALTA